MAPVEERKRPASPVLDEQSEAKKHQDTPKPAKAQKAPKVNRRRYRIKAPEPTSPLGVLQHEIEEILESHGLTKQLISNDMTRLLNDQEVEDRFHRQVSGVKILKLLSNGDGVAVIPHPEDESKRQICIVPFGLPGDVGVIKVFKTHPLYVESDLLDITEKSSYRKDELINCKYFGKCSGCQYQNVDYEQQLVFKRQTIENAFKFFAPKLSAANILPAIGNTQESPLQYTYRTKLTPHFNLPYRKGGHQLEYKPNLGFGAKGRPTWRKDMHIGSGSIIDIEECSIGTEIINIGMKNEKQRFERDFKNYRKGATILLREDTELSTGDLTKPGSTNEKGEKSTIEVTINDTKLTKSCVTDPRQIVTEYVNGFRFEFSGGEFFQNNNSILPIVTDYVRSNLSIPNSQPGEPNFLVDAYCGSGLFSITCSGDVSKVVGVEVSADSVKFAERNAKSNNIENATFIVGKAEKIFGNIDTPADRTSVILDPPRKGCDDVFLNQLSEYHPAKIVYISCNVHSQARDIDWFINETKNGGEYVVESIKGFDFFPQTHHVESVAVLRRK
ncbi:S-adenosyl-L-methionine-dependent methyltransferase [Suhomyces tanzawaensis NRRL Y-17324]|uniref:tRNA (uracil(54)-C(5))-methyltransferase n=1 Tax=Suhomyces tanzawaensis NRRL Y-17324 TaxID=984487 RepID=A0A1E4SDP3_9ASCO|nr:S-adenosyl-L-methionine-dependent methyltransferase [Suhomyces tanzawaensis NRRL Y-17324]ODV77603.1 S-adenosyl-L-methionine-dependent methyltransferase [Suhomyces tanzawaensis NRRL Y-17324]